jgi:hypothetical protein
VLELHAETQLALKAATEEETYRGHLEELADLVYALRKLEEMFDDSRKQAKRAKELMEKIACLVWMKRADFEPIRTDYVTASPNIRQICSAPTRKKDPEGFKNLMDHMGIPEDVWNRPEELVRPHFPGFAAWISELAENGLPLPKGIDPDKTWPVYSLRLKPKKGVNEDVDD